MIRGFRLDTVKNEINVLISHMLVIAKETTKKKERNLNGYSLLNNMK